LQQFRVLGREREAKREGTDLKGMMRQDLKVFSRKREKQRDCETNREKRGALEELGKIFKRKGKKVATARKKKRGKQMAEEFRA